MICTVCGYVCNVLGCVLCKSGICPLDQAKRAMVEPMPVPPPGFLPKPPGPSDLDFNSLAHAIEVQAAAGAVCFMKFTCALCGSRQTITGSPNGVHMAAVCEEDGFVTNIGERGGGFMLVLPLGKDAREHLLTASAVHSAQPNHYESKEGSA
jgi:hypothetical protein